MTSARPLASCCAHRRPAPVDASAIDDLVAPHLDRARAVAARILGCEHLAEDALQEALISLWRTGAPPAGVRAWLVRAVVLRSRHLRRTLLRRQHHERCAGDAACDLHAECSNPLHVAFAHEVGHAIALALRTLPADQRETFALYEVEGFDYAEIAQRVGAPVGTIRSRLHRARAALRGALRE